MKIYDVAIVGGGPAGLTAALYAGRSGRSVIVFEGDKIGGRLLDIDIVENYPGAKGVTGAELADTMLNQAQSFGAEIIRDFVTSVSRDDDIISIYTNTEEYAARAVILAMGITRSKLGFEENYIGRGVSYCATCDGNFYKGKDVAVAGNGYTAVEDAIYLSNLCAKVYLIYNGKLVSDEKSLEKLNKTSNIIQLSTHFVVGLEGEDSLEKAEIFDKNTKTKSLISVSGLFVALGSQPIGEIASGLRIRGKKFIITSGGTNTRLKNIYAAGDVVYGSQKQIVSACAAGALCVDKIIKNEG